MSTPDIRATARAHIALRERLLETWPELEEDRGALIDTLNGISNFEEQVVALLRHVIEREAHGKALATLIDEMGARKRRLEEGAKNLRGAALQAMQEAGLPKISAPDMSISVGRGKPKVVIVDGAQVPDDYCRIERVPSKTAIAEALGRGERVAGAELGNAQPFLSVHRK